MIGIIVHSQSGDIPAQIFDGVIVGIILLVGGWIVRRMFRSIGDDIKTSVISELTSVIDNKVTEKTAPIIAQFANNGGKTMKDGIDRLERGQAKQAGELQEVKDMTQRQGTVLGEHIAFHKGSESRPAAKKVAPRRAVKKAVTK